MASDWPRHFQFLLFTAQRNLAKLKRKEEFKILYKFYVSSGRSENQDVLPGLWLADTFSTTSVQPRNGIQRNLAWGKFSTPSTKFVSFEPIIIIIHSTDPFQIEVQDCGTWASCYICHWTWCSKGEQTVSPKALKMFNENMNLWYKNNFHQFWSEYCWILW